MSKIEFLNKKILDNLKHVHPTNGELSSYVNGGGRPPNHGLVDFKLIKELKDDQNIDRNTDRKEIDGCN